MSWRCADKQSTLGLHWFCTKGRGLRLHHIAQGFHHPHADVACHNILGECDLWLQLLFHARKMSESHLGVLRCSTDLVWLGLQEIFFIVTWELGLQKPRLYNTILSASPSYLSLNVIAGKILHKKNMLLKTKGLVGCFRHQSSMNLSLNRRRTAHQRHSHLPPCQFGTGNCAAYIWPVSQTPSSAPAPGRYRGWVHSWSTPFALDPPLPIGLGRRRRTQSLCIMSAALGHVFHRMRPEHRAKSNYIVDTQHQC